MIYTDAPMTVMPALDGRGGKGVYLHGGNADPICVFYHSDREGRIRRFTGAEEYAERLALCWNAHDDLVAACELFVRYDGENCQDDTTTYDAVKAAILAALRKATPKPTDAIGPGSES